MLKKLDIKIKYQFNIIDGAMIAGLALRLVDRVPGRSNQSL